MNVLLIAILGAAGVLTRYGADTFLAARFQNFPLATLLVNILGCLIAGIIAVAGNKSLLSPPVHVAMLVGFCGGFTTFSAYALQSLVLFEKGNISAAVINLILNPVLGFIAVAVGYFGSRSLLS